MIFAYFFNVNLYGAANPLPRHLEMNIHSRDNRFRQYTRKEAKKIIKRYKRQLQRLQEILYETWFRQHEEEPFQEHETPHDHEDVTVFFKRLTPTKKRTSKK